MFYIHLDKSLKYSFIVHYVVGFNLNFLEVSINNYFHNQLIYLLSSQLIIWSMEKYPPKCHRAHVDVNILFCRTNSPKPNKINLQ